MNRREFNRVMSDALNEWGPREVLVQIANQFWKAKHLHLFSSPFAQRQTQRAIRDAVDELNTDNLGDHSFDGEDSWT